MYEELMTLRQHRNMKMWSIRRLAEASKTGTQTIVKIEKGDRVKPSSFERLATALEVMPEQIREFMRIVMDD